ncbi:MAG TPA: citrate/2-methylcitrate synthase [Streptosporangiaceae bacterium]
MNDQVKDWIDAAEAARRLGVKPATLYAYVSRGVLRRRRADDGRRSLFDPAEVAELAGRGRPRRPPGQSELVIESAITALGPDRPYYRGRDALDLAHTYGGAPDGFERVAGWLWTGELATPDRWSADPAGLAAGYAAQSALPADVLPLDRLQVIATALAAVDPLRFHLDSAGVVAAGQSLIAGMVDCLPPAGRPSRGAADVPPDVPAGGVAERLWRRLCPAPPEPGLVEIVRAALILLADHELAASTLAARVAASVRADPYAVVAAGLGVASGPLHGGASFGVERMLAEVREPAQAAPVIGERLRRGERIPGFGHTIYREGDARMGFVYGLIAAAAPGHERLAAADALLAEARRRRLPGPNIDFATGTLAAVAGMVAGAGEAIFAVARTAGWLAHALEEYEGGPPIRLRAHYIGPAI